MRWHQVNHIFNNIIRNGKALLARCLSGKNMFSMLPTDPIAKHRARYLRLFRHIDNKHPIGFGGQTVFDQ
jgi:hypothetical protein